MPENTFTDAALLTLALLLCTTGMAWFALAMEVHWQQVRGKQTLTQRSKVLLRILGALALFTSLLVCLWVDHISMAALVWIMTLTASTLAVTFTFAWRPRWFAPLVAWLPSHKRRLRRSTDLL